MRAITKSILTTFVLLTVLLSSQCLGAEVNESTPDTDTTNFTNPERGWYRSMETQEATLEDLVDYRRGGVTLVAFETYLGAYLDKPLDKKKLDEIDRALTMARAAGLSVIYRAAYDFDGKSNPDPRDINTVLGHIAQLKPIFYKHEDVLFNVQAGFLGPWGEWHHSRYGDPVKPEYQKLVANALLDAVPKSVTIAVRRPEYVRTIAGTAPLTAEEAFSGTTLSRMAFHNDALMSERTDMDTYIDPAYPLEKEFAWINNHTRYTPFIGETNKVSSYNDAKKAIDFLDLMNAHSLNIEYHPDVLKKWQKARQGNMSAFDYIGMKLGYRFELKHIVLSETARSGGGNLSLEMELMNTGFGHLLREKKFEIVLKQGSQIFRAKIDEDARFWDKNQLISRTYNFQLPSNIPPGEWDVYLGLSSTFESLADNPAYSVRFANQDMWDAKLGLNKIGTIHIEEAANGANGDGNKEFKQIGS